MHASLRDISRGPQRAVLAGRPSAAITAHGTQSMFYWIRRRPRPHPQLDRSHITLLHRRANADRPGRSPLPGLGCEICCQLSSVRGIIMRALGVCLTKAAARGDIFVYKRRI